MEPQLIPMKYKCGHEISVLSPGSADVKGKFQEEYVKTSAPITVPWIDKCWKCDTKGYTTVVPPETTEALAKAKRGENNEKIF